MRYETSTEPIEDGTLVWCVLDTYTGQIALFGEREDAEGACNSFNNEDPFVTMYIWQPRGYYAGLGA